MARAELSYCAAEVRRDDPDRFFAALFAPAARREGLLTLYAFNLELARARERAREPMLGLIRLQWWRDALAAIAGGGGPAHAVATPLAALVRAAPLSRVLLERLIDAREQDFTGPPASLAALERYAEASAGTLTALAFEALGVRGEAAGEVAAELGIAWALVGLLRAVPFHAAQERLCLPLELLAEASIPPEALFAGGAPAGLAAVVRPIAARAREHLAAARRLRGALPRQALAALLPAVLADGHLRALARAGYDPYALGPPGPPRLGLLRLALAAARGRY